MAVKAKESTNVKHEAADQTPIDSDNNSNNTSSKTGNNNSCKAEVRLSSIHGEYFKVAARTHR